MKLTKEEQDILASVERGGMEARRRVRSREERYEAAAHATLRKDKRVNIRMTERDYRLFQEKAAEEGLPYQTLMSSVLHKFINNPGRPRD